MDVLIAKEKVFDMVHHSEIKEGDEFYYGYDSTAKRAIKRRVIAVIEQRKERGQYKDESNRRMWAKVEQEIVVQDGLTVDK